MRPILAFVLLACCGTVATIATPVDARREAPDASAVPDVAAVDASAVDAPREAAVDVLSDAQVFDVADVAKDGMSDVPADVVAEASVDAPADIPQEPACGSMTPGNCCGIACPTGEHGVAPTCVSGRCVVVCAAGWGNCDGVEANGCEVDLSRVTAHCGACGAPCASGRVCSEGACVTSCRAGLWLCPDGCRDLMGEMSNCGGCGSVCARRACINGRCI